MDKYPLIDKLGLHVQELNMADSVISARALEELLSEAQRVYAELTTKADQSAYLKTAVTRWLRYKENK